MIIQALNVPDYYLLGSIPTLILIAIVLFAVFSQKKEKDSTSAELWDGEVIDESEEPVLPTVIGARVSDMRVENGYNGGYKAAKPGVAFIIVFETEDGEIKKFTVPEALYVSVEKNQTGMLVYVGKTFYDFGDGEAIEGSTAETSPDSPLPSAQSDPNP